MLQKFKEVVSKIKVNPKNMIRNIELNRGIIYSQKVLTELMKKGLSRMDAYDLIQKISLEVINNNSNFKEEIFKNKRIRNILDEKILNKIFDPYSYLSNIDKIYKRFNLS
jgi:adenylosuccinate lyase